jgi:hypothetical protein
VLDYIRASMDILLNLKIEQAMFDNQKHSSKPNAGMYINSSRGGHGTSGNEMIAES